MATVGIVDENVVGAVLGSLVNVGGRNLSRQIPLLISVHCRSRHGIAVNVGQFGSFGQCGRTSYDVEFHTAGIGQFVRLNTHLNLGARGYTGNDKVVLLAST